MTRARVQVMPRRSYGQASRRLTVVETVGLRLGSTMLCAAVSLPAVSAEPASCSLAGITTTEEWQQTCDHAIELETAPARKAALLFRRAYVRNENQAFEDASRDLDLACALDPHNPRYLRERGYTRNSLGEYEAALVDLNEQAALVPDEPAVYSERALSRHWLGDLRGAYADRVRAVELRPTSASALLARADSRLWLGEFDQAAADAARAKEMARQSEDADTAKLSDVVLQRISAWASHSPAPDAASNCAKSEQLADLSSTTLIGDCTLAFLAATTGTARAAALTTRSLAWMEGQKSELSADASADSALAAAFDPGNANMHANLAFSLLTNHHSRAAVREFDRSLAIKQSALALAGRAHAKHNLGDPEGSFADARASNEIEPNEVSLLVLGDLAYERKDLAAARQFWMGAYHLGSRDDRTFERLRSVGVDNPDSK